MTRLALSLALTGDLAAAMAEEEARLAGALMLAADVTGEQVRDWFRRDVRAAGLGERLARTWTYQVWPKRGVSAEPAVTVFTKAPKIFESMTTGETIKGRNGTWLAIPTENAPKRIFGKRVTPDLYERRYGIGRLSMVLTGARSAILVDRNVRTRRGSRSGYAIRKAGARGKSEEAVMFVLVPQVRPARRMHLSTYENRGAALFAQLAEAQLAREVSSPGASAGDRQVIADLRSGARAARRRR